ncbi:MAG: DegT/DnrJ/EryC1/StrS family aminotransferase [Leptospiraceae bacterium]|nr:DegT/DnrJ/EryC1/StrS family aminotransferase [Leptospiraceae bacterium]MCP5496028.1 DegT/DnrJ/EryC1/StrS family aminotransferase [Leptospiraceae bacterium]
MSVPFIDIKRYESGFLDKWNEKVSVMSKNASFIGGVEVSNLEQSLKDYTKTGYAISCANGTDAIQLALRAISIGRGHKVLVPETTFWATFEAIVNAGADPYTVETNMDDLQMDFHEFEKAIDKFRPDAAILVHLYGWGSTRLQDFRELCKKKNIPLVEDGAQCFGTLYKGEPIYQNAYISTTSFYPAKVLGGAGDGGCVFTNESKLAEIVRTLANHGRTTHYGHGYVGWNSRLDSMQAAFLNLVLERFPDRLKSRIEYANRYHKELKSLGINNILPPGDYTQNGYCNVNLFSNEERVELEKLLKEKGIGYGIIYPGAMSEQPGAKDYIKGKTESKNAIEISQTVLNLPLFSYMTDSEFDEVITIVKSFKVGKN